MVFGDATQISDCSNQDILHIQNISFNNLTEKLYSDVSILIPSNKDDILNDKVLIMKTTCIAIYRLNTQILFMKILYSQYYSAFTEYNKEYIL